MIKLTHKILVMTVMMIFPGFILGQEEKKEKTVITYGPDEQTLLWKVSSPNFPGDSYIFGTMHILCESDARISETLKNIIKDVDKVYFEVDMDNMAEMMGAMRFFKMLDNKTLTDFITQDDYNRLDSFLKANNSLLPLQMMNNFKPVLISSLLAQSLLGCEKTNGMEMVIMEEAQQHEKEIAGLETMEFQAGIFDSIPYEEQARMLMMYVDSMENYRSASESLAEAYLKQDLNRLESLMVQSDPSMNKYMDLMLYQRNRNWIDPMLSQMTDKPALFAVGAGHLPGSEGILELLRKRGYKVTPVKN